VQDYRNLKVWKLAIALARETYQATSGFPSDERFKLRAQIRSAASSVPANIAEGRARGRDREFAYFLRIALGSATELESHLFREELRLHSPRSLPPSGQKARGAQTNALDAP
jgi:four helix bundle protein